jgi:alpha-L-rhamnosidase
MFMRRINKSICVISIAVFFLSHAESGLCYSNASGKQITVSGLKCASKVNPLGIDSKNPRLTWMLTSEQINFNQAAYQIIVATSNDFLSADKGDLWDSGKIKSKQSVEIAYSGKPLESGMTCHWKVRVWDTDGKVTNWSEPSKWEMGLMNPSDWKGKWIDDGKILPVKDEDFYKEDPAPLFRKGFAASGNIKKARLYISGLGYYLTYLNGKRIGDHELDPGWTDYADRVYYSTYDVTELIQKGENCLGVILGNGWYNPLPLKMWGGRNIREALFTGRPGFICQLQIENTDGTKQVVVSDQAWKVHEGPMMRNSIYLGEVYDARKEIKGWDEPSFDDTKWAPVTSATKIPGILQAQPQPPIRITAVIKPVKITEPLPGIFIFDMGQNFSGWARLKFNAPKGTQIVMRYGELLYKDGTLNPMTSVCGQIKGKKRDGTGANIGGPGSPDIAWQSDTYIAKGEGGEVYTPRFTFHGFRYVEISGLQSRPELSQCEGLRLNSAVEPVGTFACSDTLLNEIQKTCEWTFLSNIFSVQSDCPHRERFGYGGDIVATSEAFIYNYDMSDFYSKAVSDWKDAVRENGKFPDTAPFVGINYCGVGWAMVHPLLQLQLFRYYGNRSLINDQYAASKAWINQVSKDNPAGIIHDGLSDHEGLTERPSDVMVTPLYFQSAAIMEELAGILNLKEDVQLFKALKEKIRTAYVNQFLDKSTGKVGIGTQGSQSFALYTGIIPDEYRSKVLEYMVSDIRDKKNGHLSTGIMGTKFMLDQLSRNGQHRLAMEIVRQPDFPGWGYMLANGATTLWEHWALNDNTFSHNHPMFGSVSQWFYNWLGGIQPGENAEGFDQIIIRPETSGSLSWVNCSYNSVKGKIVSNWKKKDGNLVMEVEIPANTSALVCFPGWDLNKIGNSGIPLAKSAGISDCRIREGRASCRVTSGKYSFVVKDVKN